MTSLTRLFRELLSLSDRVDEHGLAQDGTNDGLDAAIDG